MASGTFRNAWIFAAFCAAGLGITAALAENANGQDDGAYGHQTSALGRNGTQDDTGEDGDARRLAIPACAKDPDKLGISRVVEIDSTGGPVFGGSHVHNAFLKDHEVVLTFDDGPMRTRTRRVLKALEDHCTRATFFMVGRMAVADPAMVREVIAAGHTVGTHTYAHRNLKAVGLLKARSDFELGYSAVTKAAGQPIAPFFRFPYLSESRQVLDHLKKRNIASFFIDVDSKDFQTRDSDAVFKRIMSQLNVSRKGIILMHDIQPSTSGLIARLLDTLHDQGYKVVHIVPKSSEPTLAEFDVPAAQALAAKGGKGKQSPLTERSITAAMPDKDDPEPETASNTANQLPWAVKPAAKPRHAPKPSVQPQPEDLPWQTRSFPN